MIREAHAARRARYSRRLKIPASESHARRGPLQWKAWARSAESPTKLSRSGHDSTSKTSGTTGNSALCSRQRNPRTASRFSTVSIVTSRRPSLYRPPTRAIAFAPATGSSWYGTVGEVAEAPSALRPAVRSGVEHELRQASLVDDCGAHFGVCAPVGEKPLEP